jgi:hypothetical protein
MSNREGSTQKRGSINDRSNVSAKKFRRLAIASMTEATFNRKPGDREGTVGLVQGTVGELEDTAVVSESYHYSMRE